MPQVRKLLALMITLSLLLGSCAKTGGEDELALKLRAKLISAKRMDAAVAMKADYGDYVFDFAFKLSYTPDGGCSITVVKPEVIAGLTATAAGGSTSLKFSGVEVNTGDVPGSEATPIEALPQMLDAWKSAYIKETYAGKTGDAKTLNIGFEIDENTSQTLVADADSLLPLEAEIRSNGRTVISCAFTDVSIE